MDFLRRFATPTLAALIMVSLPAWTAFALDSAGKTTRDQTANELPKGSPGDPMVRVNGVAITRLELDRAVKVTLAQNHVPQPLPPELKQQAQDAALDQLTSAELLFQEASKLEIKDLDKLVSEKVAQNRAKFGSDAEMDKALKGADMTPKDMQDFARKELVITNYIDKKFASKAAVSDAEAQKFYQDNLEKYFKQPERVRASHILIGSDDKASPEERKKAKEKAEALLKRVKAGEDFATLAKTDSTCPSSKQGGDLGSFSRGQMVPPFEQAAFALKPGEVSGVVETQFGYHIIKLTDLQAASTQKFDAVKEKITEYLKREKTQKGIDELVAKLRQTAKIEKIEKM